MEIKIDDKVIFTFTEQQKKIIQNDISEDIFNEDMERRIKYILMHKYESCLNRLKSEWMSKLKENGEKSIPLEDEEFCELVFSQSNYQSKKKRSLEEKTKKQKNKKT